jgi:hypothetical protein
MPNSQLLQLMGLPRDEDDISYDICLDLSNASWDEVSSRITTHPAEVSEEDCLHGNSPLEILVKSQSNEEIPLDIYRKILLEESDSINEALFIKIVRKKYSEEYMESLMNLFLDFATAVDGRRLIEMSIWYGNIAAVRVIIERFPEALGTKDAIKGQLPLHVACEEDVNSIRQWELIELLLRQGVIHNVCGEAGAGGLFERDHKGRTPVMQIIHTMNNPFTWDATHFENCVKIGYESACKSTLCRVPKVVTFQIENDANYEVEPEFDHDYVDHGQFHFPILHEAMLISSPEAFYRIIEVVKRYDTHLAGKDRRGRTALIKAIYLDQEESKHKQRFKRKTSTSDVIKLIFSAVTSDCAKIRDGAGRLPIHIATEMGLCWDEGVGLIAFANDEGLEEKHCVTGIYPFMMAATGRSKDLNTIFQILRQKPEVLVKAMSFPKSREEQKVTSKPLPIRKPVHFPIVHSWEQSPSSGTTDTSYTFNSS